MGHVDLSHRLADGSQVYPGDPAVSLTPHATVDDDGYRVTRLALGSHAGTHVDAPAHTEPDGRTIDSFDAFVFDAVRVDCTGLAPRASVGRDDLPADPPDADALVLHTGWDAHWGTDRYLDHPYLAPDAAEWCARRGYAVATDTLSPDPTPTDAVADDEPDGVPAHHALLGADRLVIENLRGLGRLTDRFELRAYPLAVADADGAPARAVGVVPDR